MFMSIQSRRVPAVLGIIAMTFVGLALAIATNGASAAAGSSENTDSSKQRTTERLVVRGEDTVKDVPCEGGLCIELADGAFRGTPVGTGAYAGAIQLNVAETFANGEGGVCAPMKGSIVLGTGSPDRLVLALAGDSCQDGAGDVREASFTGLALFVVKHGTGVYEKARGSGLASFSEDATDRERMTLIGRISR
jgi:hypothetical protein